MSNMVRWLNFGEKVRFWLPKGKCIHRSDQFTSCKKKMQAWVVSYWESVVILFYYALWNYLIQCGYLSNLYILIVLIDWFWLSLGAIHKVHILKFPNFWSLSPVRYLKLVSAIQIFIFHQMIALQKLWRIFYISSKKHFLVSRYSNFCISVFPSFSTCQPLL